MSYPLLERVHGYLAILGLALLLHPIASLPSARPWTRRTAWMAAAALAVPFAIGWAIYPTYREYVRVGLAPAPRSLFELKEHLAAIAVALALAGAVAAQGEHDARRLARHLLSAAFACGISAALLGIWVASGG